MKLHTILFFFLVSHLAFQSAHAATASLLENGDFSNSLTAWDNVSTNFGGDWKNGTWEVRDDWPFQDVFVMTATSGGNYNLKFQQEIALTDIYEEFEVSFDWKVTDKEIPYGGTSVSIDFFDSAKRIGRIAAFNTSNEVHTIDYWCGDLIEGDTCFATRKWRATFDWETFVADTSTVLPGMDATSVERIVLTLLIQNDAGSGGDLFIDNILIRSETSTSSSIIDTNWWSNRTSWQNVIDPLWGTPVITERVRLSTYTTGYIEGTVPLSQIGDWNVNFLVHADTDIRRDPADFTDVFINGRFMKRVFNDPAWSSTEIRATVSGNDFDYRFEFKSGSTNTGLHQIVGRGTATLNEIPPPDGTFFDIQGTVRLEDWTPICAFVLANGSYTFSCDGAGSYALNVPLDEHGNITLFSFADGFAPLRITAEPDDLPSVLYMETAVPGSPRIRIVSDAVCSDKTGWVNIFGSVTSEDGQSLCAMVLANGKHMFSCDSNFGRFHLTVPVDGHGQVTLFAFADSFQPHSDIIAAPACGIP